MRLALKHSQNYCPSIRHPLELVCVILRKGGGTGRRTGLRSQPSKEDGGSSPPSCTSQKEEMGMCSDTEIPEINGAAPMPPPQDASIDYNDLLKSLKFSSVQRSSHLLRITIEVEESLANVVFTQTIEYFKNSSLGGLDLKRAPYEYVQEMYTEEIFGHTKDYFLHYVAIDFLMNEIIARKITLVNYPRFVAVDVSPEKKISYHFDVSVADALELKEWKHFAFRSPKRKRYKDLDKQVCAFVESRHNQSRRLNYTLVEEDDWILFETTLLDCNFKPVHGNCRSSFWIKLGRQELSDSLSCQFINKSIGDCFQTSTFSGCAPSHQSGDCSYTFLVTIKAIIKSGHTSLDVLKATFRLKNKTDVHNKLMEIFSYRNDVSQRQAIIEEVFHLLLSKHRFEVPKHLILRREEDIIGNLSRQPDYHVYKSQEDFQTSVEMLAEKQLKEEIIIDQIAYNENIKADLKDIINYLYLLNSKRLKEFIYFKPILERIEETSNPINTSTITQAVMREKTLNFIIHSLTK
jgi:FKBP-type peptidyl-prolyl cis-trans isomerase (trigger factor)